MTAKHICFDRILPQDLYRPHEMRPDIVRAIAPRDKRWVNGSTLTIGFMGGTSRQQSMVKSFAPEWTDYANLRFDFVDDPLKAIVRVSFDQEDGAWSYIGTDTSTIPRGQATLNLGWQDRGVILHEFGHMVGLGHEHQNPDQGIKWNEEEVYRDLSGPPNYWSRSTIKHNVLDKYSKTQIFGTQFDPDSIMLYAFPREWTLDGFSTHENKVLSSQDKAFVASAEMYPKVAPPDVRAVRIAVGQTLAGRIAKPGEEDLYTFTASQAGDYEIATRGYTDVVARLYGPDDPTHLIAEDDDSGRLWNAEISAALLPGEYYVQINHFSKRRTGNYKVSVGRTG